MDRGRERPSLWLGITCWWCALAIGLSCTPLGAGEIERDGPQLLHAEGVVPAPSAQSVIPPGSAPALSSVPEIPSQFVPWWDVDLSRPLHRASDPLVISLDSVILGTLEHSAQVRLLSDAPLIRRSAVTEAQANFDLRSFMETRFVDTSDPVGSTLTTGGANRYNDQNWTASGGVRKRGSTGAELEAAQKFGYQDNNSIYFVPAEQGTSRLSLSLTQPLLNGAGAAYNSSLIVLAEIDANIARDQLSKELQALLVEVHRSYWDLYQQRVTLLQKRKLYEQALRILEELNARRDVDVLESQIAKASAAVATREADTIRFAAYVRNAEAKLRALVNDPRLVAVPGLELVPREPPGRSYRDPNLQDSLLRALERRPEINQLGKEIRAANVREEVSRNELLPVLNLILSSYMSGLQGDSDIGGAFGDQFTVGRPTYSAGLLFEVPYGNRAAKARLQQRRLELRRLTNQLEATVLNVRAEVEMAVREVATTYREMVSKYHAMSASEVEIMYLRERWRLLPGDGQVAGVVLEDLLNAQERLSKSESSFVAALVAYNIALVNLHRVTGTLLEYEEITEIQTCDDGLPSLSFQKQIAGVKEAPTPVIVPQGPTLQVPETLPSAPVPERSVLRPVIRRLPAVTR